LGADDDDIGHFAGIPSATISTPSQESRPGPLAREASHRIKEAGYRRKQERGRGGRLGVSQPIDIP
jgi:hypothetical protein